jgi:hypothetical protein
LLDFLHAAQQVPVVNKTATYPLAQANQTLADLRAAA